MRGRLHTAAITAIYNHDTPTDCWLCGLAPEDQAHQMFSYYNSTGWELVHIWKSLIDWSNGSVLVADQNFKEWLVML